MDKTDFYDLPMLVGEQYMLTSVIREERDAILYRGTQRDLRREVMVEVLRKSAAGDKRNVELFMDNARVQAGFQGEHLLRVLEVMEAKGTWMVAKESPEGEPLDMMSGVLSALDVCTLMMLICQLCLRMDAEYVASDQFHLENVYYSEHYFQLANPARAGKRARGSSRRDMAEAAHQLLALLDARSALATPMASVLRRIAEMRSNSRQQPALYLAEFSRIYALMVNAK